MNRITDRDKNQGLGAYQNAGREYRVWDWAETVLDLAMLLALGCAVWVLYLVGWAW